VRNASEKQLHRSEKLCKIEKQLYRSEKFCKTEKQHHRNEKNVKLKNSYTELKNVKV